MRPVRPEIVMLAGLPGCGKTRYLDDLRRRGWRVFDDFKAKAIDNSSQFDKSRQFENLVACLRAGHRCAVADIDFCKNESRAEAGNALRALLPDLEIRWCFFPLDERACEENIRRRGRDSLEEDLRKLRDYSRVYSIPDGGHVCRIQGWFEQQIPHR